MLNRRFYIPTTTHILSATPSPTRPQPFQPPLYLSYLSSLCLLDFLARSFPVSFRVDFICKGTVRVCVSMFSWSVQMRFLVGRD